MCGFGCWSSGFGSPWGWGCGFRGGGGFLGEGGEVLFGELGGWLGFGLRGWGGFVLLLGFVLLYFGFVYGTTPVAGNMVAVTVGTGGYEIIGFGLGALGGEM